MLWLTAPRSPARSGTATARHGAGHCRSAWRERSDAPLHRGIAHVACVAPRHERLPAIPLRRVPRSDGAQLTVLNPPGNPMRPVPTVPPAKAGRGWTFLRTPSRATMAMSSRMPRPYRPMRRPRIDADGASDAGSRFPRGDGVGLGLGRARADRYWTARIQPTCGPRPFSGQYLCGAKLGQLDVAGRLRARRDRTVQNRRCPYRLHGLFAVSEPAGCVLSGFGHPYNVCSSLNWTCDDSQVQSAGQLLIECRA